jgi:pilus assembly protein CpaE
LADKCQQAGAEELVILITVSSDASFHREAGGALKGHFRFAGQWQIGYQDTVRLRTAAPDEKYIIIVDFADPTRALQVARSVDGRPEFASIAVGGGSSRDELLQLMQAGICDVLPQDSPGEVRKAASRAIAKLTSTEELAGEICAFVPAKPGCGATTMAVYATAAAARLSGEATLLLDFDIRLGVTSFLLKAGGNHTILDALQQSDRLDHDLWASMVTQCGDLHLVGSGPVEFSRPIPAERFSEVLNFAVQEYSLISVDLPGTMEEFEARTLLRSKRIFLVCNSDIGALHVAYRKSSWLRDLGLADKVSVILNCMERRSALSVADIERIIQMPVRYPVPAGAAEILRAVQKGLPIEGTSALAKQIGKIAADMVQLRPIVKKPSPVRRFIEYFSVSAARDLGTP